MIKEIDKCQRIVIMVQPEMVETLQEIVAQDAAVSEALLHQETQQEVLLPMELQEEQRREVLLQGMCVGRIGNGSLSYSPDSMF